MSSIVGVNVAEERKSEKHSDQVSAALKALRASRAPWQQRQPVKRVAKEGWGCLACQFLMHASAIVCVLPRLYL